MIGRFLKLNAWLLIALLCATPLIAALAPRSFSWWPALLGLLALPLGEKGKSPLWIAASTPLWAATLSLCSIMWAAFPDVQFDKAIDRLPMMYGLAMAVIGLSRLHTDVWDKALRVMPFVFAGGVIAAFIEYSFHFPLYHLYNTNVAMAHDRVVIQAVMNRGLTALAMFAIPSLWILWREGRERLALFLLVFMTAGLMVTEASAVTLAVLVAEIVFVAAWFAPVLVRWLITIGGAVKIMAMPLVAATLFPNMPDWDALKTPSNGGRLEIWHGLSEWIAQSPVLGYGYEVTRFLPLRIENLYFKFPTVMHPHNAPLQVWIEFGAVGAVLATIGWVVWSLKSRSAISLALLAMIATIGALAYGLWQGPWLGLAIFTMLYWRAAATAFGNKIQ